MPCDWPRPPRAGPSLKRGKEIDTRGTSAPAPLRRALRRQAVGAPIPGHEVSGAGRQALARGMQSIATMEPVWQCGPGRPTTTVRLLDARKSQRALSNWLRQQKHTYLVWVLLVFVS